MAPDGEGAGEDWSALEVARHEAAHAVLIHALGLPWKPGWRVVVPTHPGAATARGSVVPVVRAFGDSDPAPRRTVFRACPISEPGLDQALRRHAAGDAIMLAAGSWAQFPDSWSWSPAHAAASRTDRRHVEAGFSEVGFDPPNPWSTLNHAAIRAVDSRWGTIEAVAAALIERRELSDAEVLRIATASSVVERRNPQRVQCRMWAVEAPVELIAEALNGWRTPVPAPERRAEPTEVPS